MDVAIDLDLGKPYRVSTMRLVEALGEPTTCSLELVSHHDLELKAALRAPVRVELRGPGGLVLRSFDLELAQASLADTRPGALVYRVELRSPFWFLGLTRDTRKFRGMTTREIVAQVLAKHVVSLAWQAQLELPVRKYTMQYAESDRAFVERQLDQEGLLYWERDGGLVVEDDSTSAPDVEGVRIFPLVDARDALRGDAPAVYALRASARLASDAYTVNDRNWKRPSDALLHTARTGAGDLEIYDFPAGYRRPDQAPPLARTRLEAVRARARTLSGSGTAFAFRPYLGFEAAVGPGDPWSGEHVLVAVTHVWVDHAFGAIPSSEFAEEAADREKHEGTTYMNHFDAVPRVVPFRTPPRHPRPTVAGTHTAMVRGPAGEEIHTDRHGRFRCQFHWDREAQGNDEDSRWVRMLQERHSGVFLARVGWEARVAYLDGDPERPVGLGRDINGVMIPAYDQPANKTRFTIKTPSYPKTGGWNELRMEDLAGEEQIFVRAEKDLSSFVTRDKTELIGRDERQRIGRNAARAVNRDQQVEIGRNLDQVAGQDQSSRVAGNRSQAVGGDEQVEVGADLNLGVTGDDVESVGAMRFTFAGGPAITADGALGALGLEVPGLGGGIPGMGGGIPGMGGGIPGMGGGIPGMGGGIPGVGGLLGGGGLSPSSVASLFKGSIRRVGEDISRTVGGAWITVSMNNIVTAAEDHQLELVGGARIAICGASIATTVAGVCAQTVGGAWLDQAKQRIGMESPIGTTQVGGMARITGDETLEVRSGMRIAVTALARGEIVGGETKMSLTPDKITVTVDDILIDCPGEVLLRGKDLHIVRKGGGDS